MGGYLSDWRKAQLQQWDENGDAPSPRRGEMGALISEIHGLNREVDMFERANQAWAEKSKGQKRQLAEARNLLRDLRPEVQSLIAGIHHSHVNPADGIVHDEDAAHEISQLQSLYDRIDRFLTGDLVNPGESPLVLIYSGEHAAYWRPGGAGYTKERSEDGRYTRAQAERITSHCGPEKAIKLVPITAAEAMA